jgi:hypothetical protein
MNKRWSLPFVVCALVISLSCGKRVTTPAVAHFCWESIPTVDPKFEYSCKYRRLSQDEITLLFATKYPPSQFRDELTELAAFFESGDELYYYQSVLHEKLRRCQKAYYAKISRGYTHVRGCIVLREVEEMHTQ